jgi:hypothetical protein
MIKNVQNFIPILVLTRIVGDNTFHDAGGAALSLQDGSRADDTAFSLKRGTTTKFLSSQGQTV